MNDEGDEIKGATGISRREALRKGAIVGGAVVWASPVLQTIGMQKAYAATPVAVDISFIALLLQCGGTLYRIKWDGDFTGAPDECGPNFAIGDCPAGDLPSDGVSSACPEGVSARVDPDGAVTVTFPGGCCVTDFVVKRGQCCAGPGDAGEPELSGGGNCSGVIRFTSPNTNRAC